MNKNPTQFAFLSRILHWLMAAMLLAMLFIGVAMVASLGNYHRLVATHRSRWDIIGGNGGRVVNFRLINRMAAKIRIMMPRGRWMATSRW